LLPIAFGMLEMDSPYYLGTLELIRREDE